MRSRGPFLFFFLEFWESRGATYTCMGFEPSSLHICPCKRVSNNPPKALGITVLLTRPSQAWVEWVASLSGPCQTAPTLTWPSVSGASLLVSSSSESSITSSHRLLFLPRPTPQSLPPTYHNSTSLDASCKYHQSIQHSSLLWTASHPNIAKTQNHSSPKCKKHINMGLRVQGWTLSVGCGVPTLTEWESHPVVLALTCDLILPIDSLLLRVIDRQHDWDKHVHNRSILLFLAWLGKVSLGRFPDFAEFVA